MALVDLNLLAPEQRHDHAAAIGTPIIDARHVAVKFKVEGGSVDAVKDVSFQLYRGETIASRRRIRLRKVGDGPHGHGPAHQARHRLGRTPASNTTARMS